VTSPIYTAFYLEDMNPTPLLWGKFSTSGIHQSTWRIGIHRYIIHSDKDTRHPVSIGISAFTTLQMKGGVECRYLDFPDEGHFV